MVNDPSIAPCFDHQIEWYGRALGDGRANGIGNAEEPSP